MPGQLGKCQNQSDVNDQDDVMQVSLTSWPHTYEENIPLPVPSESLELDDYLPPYMSTQVPNFRGKI